MAPRAPLILLLLAACQSDPVTGDAYYSPLGNDYASQDAFVRQNFLTEVLVAREGGLVNEPEMVAACREVFDRVAAAVPPEHRRDFQYHFLLTTSPDVNAYTYGAGRVHCHLGLLARCKDMSEFAGVMAHEIGHNSRDHFGKSLGRSAIGSTFTSIGGLAGPPGRKLTEGLTGLVAVQFTRSQERETDDLAVDYEIAAGIDPHGLARFFDAMERDFGSEGAQFFQTHPHPENRVRAIEERIEEKAGAHGVPWQRSSPRFAAALARAREILPYYTRLAEATAGEDPKAWLAAADAGALALPRHAMFHFFRGIALVELDDRAGARAALRTATSVNLGDFLVPFVWSALEFQAEDWAASEEGANALLAIIPVMPHGYFFRGISRMKLGREADGRRDLETLLALTPKKDRKKVLAQIREFVDFQVNG
ncbi:MAG TPA: M48 family metallopeptidase [Planctomycetota bacterium]|nr:M48 family metallopeptidase [Planctomycetota bacterium]